VYQPAEDTFLLLRAAEKEVTPDDRVLEIGVGSGYISSRLVSCRMVAGTDINPHAVRTAYHAGVPMVRTDLCAGIRQVFDLVIFNPPYLPTNPEERVDDWLEYALDGGENGREVIIRFIACLSEVLVPGGRALLLISSLTGIKETSALILAAGWHGEMVCQEQVEGGETLFILRLIRNC
jgi:release factor glutamine methyltransferase